MTKGRNYSPSGGKMYRDDGTIVDVPALLETILTNQNALIEALKYSVEANVDTGTATGGTTTTLTDTNKNWPADIWNNAMIEIERDGTHYIRLVTSHTGDEITFPSIGSAVEAGDKYWIKLPVEVQDIERIGGAQQSAVDIAEKINELHEAIVTNKDAGFQIKGRNTAQVVSDSLTRPDNTTEYDALDVVGEDPAENLEFDTGLEEESSFVVLRAQLRKDQGSVPTNMTSFRLHLYNEAPTAIADNTAYGLPAADRNKYIGYITIEAAAELGDTVWLQADEVNFTGKLASGSTTLYGILQAVSGYEPSAETVMAIILNIAGV